MKLFKYLFIATLAVSQVSYAGFGFGNPLSSLSILAMLQRLFFSQNQAQPHHNGAAAAAEDPVQAARNRQAEAHRAAAQRDQQLADERAKAQAAREQQERLDRLRNMEATQQAADEERQRQAAEVNQQRAQNALSSLGAAESQLRNHIQSNWNGGWLAIHSAAGASQQHVHHAEQRINNALAHVQGQQRIQDPRIALQQLYIIQDFLAPLVTQRAESALPLLERTNILVEKITNNQMPILKPGITNFMQGKTLSRQLIEAYLTNLEEALKRNSGAAAPAASS